jgi:hypothetical protein
MDDPITFTIKEKGPAHRVAILTEDGVAIAGIDTTQPEGAVLLGIIRWALRTHGHEIVVEGNPYRELDGE